MISTSLCIFCNSYSFCTQLYSVMFRQKIACAFNLFYICSDLLCVLICAWFWRKFQNAFFHVWVGCSAVISWVHLIYGVISFQGISVLFTFKWLVCWWKWAIAINSYHFVGVCVILDLVVFLLWNWMSLCLVHIYVGL